MDRVYLLSVVLLSVLTQCRECANSPPAESDRAALERAGKTGVPSYEPFTATIDELRNRFGDREICSQICGLDGQRQAVTRDSLHPG
jgi:hypothetical protein